MDSKLMKPLPKQLMLKDYLLDDLSSCSSSGFRSYPRRQCCTTVRFLLEIDLKNKYQPAPPIHKKNPPKHLLKSRLKPVALPPPPPATVSAFQKASLAVINTVKHLSFAGAKSPPSSKKKKKPMMKTIFPRSLSRKLKQSFWKRADHKEVYWWTAFNRLDKEELKSPVLSPVITAITIGDSNSSMSVSESKSKSNSWSDSDFTASSDNSVQTSSGNSTATENDVAASKKLGTEKAIGSKIVGATAVDVSSDSTTSSHGSTTNFPNTKKPCPNEEKEQFSPVSTLDCPFDDDDEVSSPFQHRLSRMEGTTKKLMKKIKRFECLTQLEPLNLENRIAFSASESESPHTNPSETETETEEDAEEEVKQTVESKALDLVQELKASMPSYNSPKLKAEKLLLDFFKEGILDACELRRGDDAWSKKLLQVAIEWINGKPIEVLLDWKVQENRMAYIRDIERRGEWKNVELEKQEVILDLEVEVFTSLMNELLVDIIFS